LERFRTDSGKEVAGDLRSALVAVVQLFKGRGVCSVETGGARRTEFVEQRLADQRVCEGETSEWPPASRTRRASTAGSIASKRIAGNADGREQIEIESRSDHGRRGQVLPSVLW